MSEFFQSIQAGQTLWLGGAGGSACPSFKMPESESSGTALAGESRKFAHLAVDPFSHLIKNPVSAGFVSSAEKWAWSSAGWAGEIACPTFDL